MQLFTAEALPEPFRVTQIFSMVMVNRTIQISAKPLLDRLFSGKKPNELDEALRALSECAPEEANAIIAIKTATCTAAFSNGTFLYLTITGTPVRFESVK